MRPNGAREQHEGLRERPALYRAVLLLVLLVAWGLLVFRLNDIPPGFQHDQMFDARDALDVLEGRGQIYFPANFGREPLFMYSAAGVFALLGSQHIVWGLRFTSVLWAMLGLAATVAYARRYLPRRAVPVAGLAMAGSFWFLFAGRLGLEPMPLVALAMAMLYFLDRGLPQVRRQAALADMAIAGVLGGVATYTYLAGRALFALAPSMLLYEAGAAVWRRARHRMAKPDAAVPGLALSFLVMLAISAPLLFYVGSHAGVADRRVGEVGKSLAAALRGDPGGLLNNTRETILAILLAGPLSLPYQYNIPGRAVLQPAWALLFVAGVAASLARLFRACPDGSSCWPARRRELLPLTALALGLAPDLVSGADALHMRGIIALPLLFIFAAGGLWAVAGIAWRVLPRQRPGTARAARVAFTVGVMFLLAGQLVGNADAYFRQWAGAERVQRIYNADIRGVAAYLTEHLAGEQIILGTDRLADLDSMTYSIYAPPRQDIRWFQLPSSPPLPAGGSAVYLLTGSVTDLPPSLAYLMSAARDRQSLPDASGRYTMTQGYRVYRQDIEAALAAGGVRAVDAPPVFGDVLRLDAAGFKNSGDGLDFISRWTVLGRWPRPQQPPKVSVSLSDTNGYRWTQFDSLTDLPYETWQPGESFIEITHVPLPSDILPGDYVTRLALYTDEGGPLGVERAGAAAGNAPAVATGKIERSPVSGDGPAAPLPLANLSGAGPLRPVGKWDAMDTLLTGVPVDLHVSWEATQALPTEGLHFRLDATAPDGRVLWTQSADPPAALPAMWPAGQTYRLTHRVQAETSAVTGTLPVRLRLCAEQEGRVPTCATVGDPKVVNHRPLFALPQRPLMASGADWNGQLTLAGYDIARNTEAIALTLYWQTRAAPPAPLKRFVHAVDKDGAIVAQADGAPENGGVPMPGWQAGEYVVDRVVLPEQPGKPIRGLYVGLYDPETGKRLRVLLPSGEPVPDDRLPLTLQGVAK